MRGFEARIRALRDAADAGGLSREEIIDAECGRIGMHLQLAFDDRDDGEDLGEYGRRLLDVYEAAPPDPSWRPRMRPPGWSGAVDLDPARLRVTALASLDRDGWPDRAWDWVRGVEEAARAGVPGPPDEGDGRRQRRLREPWAVARARDERRRATQAAAALEDHRRRDEAEGVVRPIRHRWDDLHRI